jgi:hypothetical protein
MPSSTRKSIVLEYEGLGLIRPRSTGLCTSHRLPRLGGGVWPTPYASYNYSYRSKTSRNRRKLPEQCSGRTSKLVSGYDFHVTLSPQTI